MHNYINNDWATTKKSRCAFSARVCVGVSAHGSIPLPSLPRTGELTNRLASDTSVIQSAVTENISILFRYLLQMVLSLGVMFFISPKLTAVLLSVVPVIVVGAVQYGERREGQ